MGDEKLSEEVRGRAARVRDGKGESDKYVGHVRLDYWADRIAALEAERDEWKARAEAAEVKAAAYDWMHEVNAEVVWLHCFDNRQGLPNGIHPSINTEDYECIPEPRVTSLGEAFAEAIRAAGGRDDG